jgi:hypothetical protein
MSVIHPRKELDGVRLGLSSVFGGAKATQEADNVIIVQLGALNEDGVEVGERTLDVRKNRFDGDLGRVPFRYDQRLRRIHEIVRDVPAAGAQPTKHKPNAAAAAAAGAAAPSAAAMAKAAKEELYSPLPSVTAATATAAAAAAAAKPKARKTTAAPKPLPNPFSRTPLPVKPAAAKKKPATKAAAATPSASDAQKPSDIIAE